MTATFADTFFFIALLAPDDEAHAQAVEIVANLSAPIVTSTWVLMEVGDALAKQSTRSAFAGLLESLSRDPLVEILPPDEEQFANTAELYRLRPDKDWSLTDCTSFVIMTDRGISDAFTGDHHFAQAGFIPLMK